MDCAALAELLFPDIQKSVDDLLRLYPERELPGGACVTRFAPSPTGFVHFGSFIPIMTSYTLAHKSGGVFYLRIEDTDQKREVENGVSGIISDLEKYEIRFDESVTEDGDRGKYGPYRQTLRAALYQTVAKEFVRMGRAYPCFCTPAELDEIRQRQEQNKENPGYYGRYAVHRDMPLEEVEKRIRAGRPWVLRFKSMGDPSRRFVIEDLVKGRLELPENDVDHVMLKSDGIPTYHFAHLVDDRLMHTTHVVRGDEWLATLPLHVELHGAIGWPLPRYLHISPVMKNDGGSKRKLSKRKDPEAAMSYYHAEGYPAEAVREYTMTLLNSNFEEWRAAHPAADLFDFPFTTEKMSASGALFDLMKLRDISKNIIAAMSAGRVLELVLRWAESYDAELFGLLSGDRDKAQSILAIGRGGEKPRKDLAAWSEVRPYLDFFYDELFSPDYTLPEAVNPADAAEILRRYREIYDPADMQTEWFAKIRALSESLGYAGETKAYRKNPGQYRGHVGDVSAVLRVAAAGRQNSPDMHQVMGILGRQRVRDRIDRMLETIEGK